MKNLQIEDIQIEEISLDNMPEVRKEPFINTQFNPINNNENLENIGKKGPKKGGFNTLKSHYNSELKPLNTRKSSRKSEKMIEISEKDRKRYEQDLNRISIEKQLPTEEIPNQSHVNKPAFIENINSKLNVSKKKKQPKTKRQEYLEQSYITKKDAQKARTFTVIREEVNNDIALHRVNLFNQILIAFRYKIKKSGRVKRREQIKLQKQREIETGKYASILRQLKLILNNITTNNLKEMVIQIDITSKQDIQILNDVLKKEPVFDLYNVKRIPHNPNLDKYGYKYKLPIILSISERTEKRALEF